jgi:hypothetical protein
MRIAINFFIVTFRYHLLPCPNLDYTHARNPLLYILNPPKCEYSSLIIFPTNSCYKPLPLCVHLSHGLGIILGESCSDFYSIAPNGVFRMPSGAP